MNTAALAATTLVVLAVGAGAYVIGSPGEARVLRLDERRVEDLQRLRSGVASYWNSHKALPPVLDSLLPARADSTRLRDPESAVRYEYVPSTDSSFSLCATFRRASEHAQQRLREGWYHEAGRHCYPLMATVGDVPRMPFTIE